MTDCGRMRKAEREPRVKREGEREEQGERGEKERERDG